jgi:ribonuclease D
LAEGLEINMTGAIANNYHFVRTMSDLTRICSQLAHEKYLGVDTEADSLHHYFPKVCLIQVSTERHTFLIDPLAIASMDPLGLLLAGHHTKKIFHGADYDLRSLFRDFGMRVNNLFDTMVASQFAGEKEAALASVVKKRFGITLNKAYQRANWSLRPLSPDMLTYAALDSIHLIRLYKELKRELKFQGRLTWVEEECHALSVECAVINNAGAGPLFKRFKGAGKLAPRDLAVLESILQFREKRAMEQDLPPFRVFSNRVVQDLVASKPADWAALEKVAPMKTDFMTRCGAGVLGAIERALRLPRQRLPCFPKIPRPPRNPEKEARLKRLKAWRKEKSEELDMEPGLICNNILLEALAQKNPKKVGDLEGVGQMKRWQRSSLGPEIVRALRE